MTQETIRPDQLKATNSPTNGYTVVFDSATEKFEWTQTSGISPNSFVPYSTTWSSSESPQPDIGDGVLSAKYMLRDGMCYFKLWLYVGGTTVIPSGYWKFSLPADVENIAPLNRFVGEAVLTDNSEGVYYFMKTKAVSAPSNSLEFFYLPTPSGTSLNRLTSTFPITIEGGDSLEIQVEFEVNT